MTQGKGRQRRCRFVPVSFHAVCPWCNERMTFNNDGYDVDDTTMTTFSEVVWPAQPESKVSCSECGGIVIIDNPTKLFSKILQGTK